MIYSRRVPTLESIQFLHRILMYRDNCRMRSFETYPLAVFLSRLRSLIWYLASLGDRSA